MVIVKEVIGKIIFRISLEISTLYLCRKLMIAVVLKEPKDILMAAM